MFSPFSTTLHESREEATPGGFCSSAPSPSGSHPTLCCLCTELGQAQAFLQAVHWGPLCSSPGQEEPPRNSFCLRIPAFKLWEPGQVI